VMKTRGRQPSALLAACLLALAATACSGPGARPDGTNTEPDLMRWVDQELGPYLSEQLSSHPRFKGEPVLLVGMHGPDVLPDIDELSAAIRSRLVDSLLDTPGVKLLWRPAVRPWEHHRRPVMLQCQDLSAVHYYLGIDVAGVPGGHTRVTVRALDLQDEAWVTGFGRHWQGLLTGEQRAAMTTRHPDEYLRGLRVLPFTRDQADLAAAYLAQNLSCLLTRRGDDMRIYSAPPAGNAPAALETMARLVGNHLARLQSAPVTDGPQAATHALRAETHAVHGDTYQVWMKLRPKDASGQVTTVSTLAYVRLGALSAKQPRAHLRHPAREDGLVSTLRVLTPQDGSLCASANPWRRGKRQMAPGESVPAGGCFAVELETHRDARLFLLNHRKDAALVRLLPSGCRRREQGPRLRGDRLSLRFPGADDGQVFGWEGGAALETVYALASTDPAAARALDHHLQRLPAYCETEGTVMAEASMEHWLSGLEDIMIRYPSAVDWQAVRIRHAP